jgi:three-Cys-motif partner protein
VDDLRIFRPKKIPTRVKHYVLEKCLDAWGGIIANSNVAEIRLCFVDALCGSGLYQLDTDEAVGGDPDTYEIGSAILGPTCLLKAIQYARARGRQVRGKAMLINKEKAELDTVKQALPRDVLDAITIEPRVKRFDEIKDEVVAFCHDWFSFVLIDPYGPTPTPFSAVRDVVRGRYTDTLINFPFLSLQKWSGYVFKAGLTAEERDRLTAADAFMGGMEWRDVVRQSKAAGKPLDSMLIEHYKAALKREGVHVLALPLLFEDKRRVIYHLVFTTHNVAGLAAAKRSFLQAKDAQIRLRDELRLKKTGSLQLSFMHDGDPEVDCEGLAALLQRTFGDAAVPLEDVILCGLDEPGVLDSDVKKALTLLKRQKCASYSGTSYGDTVTFHGSALPAGSSSSTLKV